MADPEEEYQRVLAEEQAKGSSPAVAEARAKAARIRSKRGLPTDPQAAAAAVKEQAPEPATDTPASPEPQQSAPVPEPAAVGATAGAAQTSAAPKGRGGRGSSAISGNGAPERLQRLLAVVKPEAIQRVEREPIDRVNTWPHLMVGEFVALLVVTVFLMIFSTVVNAPFRELANINVTPNPSKAPWYFLGLQELLRYFHAQVAGVSIPQWIILALIAAPYIDRNPSTKPEDRKLAISLFTFFLISMAVLVLIGTLFRGPSYEFIYPWDTQIVRIFEF